MLNIILQSLITLGVIYEVHAPCPALCQCVVSATAQEAAAGATVVFVGSVVASADTMIEYVPGRGLPHIALTFLIERRWKGPATDSLRILTPRDGTACGALFMPGPHLVFAHADTSGVLYTSSCDRNQPLRAARKDIRALGRPVFLRGATGH